MKDEDAAAIVDGMIKNFAYLKQAHAMLAKLEPADLTKVAPLALHPGRREGLSQGRPAEVTLSPSRRSDPDEAAMLTLLRRLAPGQSRDLPAPEQWVVHVVGVATGLLLLAIAFGWYVNREIALFLFLGAVLSLAFLTTTGNPLRPRGRSWWAIAHGGAGGRWPAAISSRCGRCTSCACR